MAEPGGHRPTRTRLSIEFTTAKQQETAHLANGDIDHVLPTYHSDVLEDLLEGYGIEDVEYGLSTEQEPGVVVVDAVFDPVLFFESVDPPD